MASQSWKHCNHFNLFFILIWCLLLVYITCFITCFNYQFCFVSKFNFCVTYKYWITIRIWPILEFTRYSTRNRLWDWCPQIIYRYKMFVCVCVYVCESRSLRACTLVTIQSLLAFSLLRLQHHIVVSWSVVITCFNDKKNIYYK